MKTRFYYSSRKFWQSFIVAIVLTAMISGLTWMILNILGNPNANLFALLAAVVFIGFFSLKMAFQYWQKEVVVAVLPTGIHDMRWNIGPIEWERIKHITLRQRETEYQLFLYLWPQEFGEREQLIDVEPLESNVEKLIEAISQYHPVRREV